MNIPGDIRTVLYALLLIFSIQLAGNGVLTILNLTTGFEYRSLSTVAHIAFGLVYAGVGMAGIYTAYRLYRLYRITKDAEDRTRRRPRRTRRLYR